MLRSGLQIPGSSQNHLLSIGSIHLCPPTSTNTSTGSTQNSLWCSQPPPAPSFPQLCLSWYPGKAESGPWAPGWDSRRAAHASPAARRAPGEDEVRNCCSWEGNRKRRENSRKCSNPAFLGESSPVASTDGRGTDVTGVTGKRPDPHGGMRLRPRRTGDAQHPGSGCCLHQAFMDKQAPCLLPPRCLQAMLLLKH